MIWFVRVSLKQYNKGRKIVRKREKANLRTQHLDDFIGQSVAT